MRERVAIVSVLLGVACGASVARTIRPEWIGTDFAKLTGYMGVNGLNEETPVGIGHEAVRDEAILMLRNEHTVCFDVTVRTAMASDEPLDGLNPRCTVGDTGSLAIVQNEHANAYDYSSIGPRRAASNEPRAVPDTAGMSHPVAADETLFRVMERQATLCCPGQGSHFALQLTNDRLRLDEMAASIRFDWKME